MEGEKGEKQLEKLGSLIYSCDFFFLVYEMSSKKKVVYDGGGVGRRDGGISIKVVSRVR